MEPNRRLSPRRLLQPRREPQEEEQQREEAPPRRPAPRRPAPRAEQPNAPWWHYRDPPKRRPIEEILGFVAGSAPEVPQQDVNDDGQYYEDAPQEEQYDEEPETLSEEDEWNDTIVRRLQELQVEAPNPRIQEQREFEERMYTQEGRRPAARRPAPRPAPSQARSAARQPAPQQARPAPRRAPTVEERQQAYPSRQGPPARVPARRASAKKFNAAAFVLQDPDIAALAANDPSAPSVNNLPEDKVGRVERLIAGAQGRGAPSSEYYGDAPAEGNYADEGMILDESENLAGPQLDPAPPEPTEEQPEAAYEEQPEGGYEDQPEPEAQ